MRIHCLVVPFLLVPLALAQRPGASFEHQKRAVTIEYGAVPVGKHSLAELTIGQTWRMGMNEASTWRLDVPVLAGDTIVAPGAYRVQLQRSAETTCKLLANGSSQALGSNADGQIDGALGKCAKPTKKLAVEWRKKGAAVLGNQPAQIVVQFGDSEWVGDVTVLGHKELKLGAWKGIVHAVPAALVDAGPVPVATLAKGDQNWNVVLDKDKVKLVPWMAAPTEQFGFGAVVGPDAAAIVEGKVEPLDGAVDKPLEVVEAIRGKSEKGTLTLEIAFGSKRLGLVFAEPKGKPGK